MIRASLATELVKFTRARVPQLATAALLVGVLALCLAFRFSPDMAAKLPLPASSWHGFLIGAGQITATGGLLGAGVVAAWMVGREFVQGTIVGLFALPVGRGTTALSKLAIYIAWVLVVGAVLAGFLALFGLALGFGPPPVDLLFKQFLVFVVTALLALPAALVATLSRGYIGGIGALVGILVLAQLGAATGLGGWFPFAAAGLWAVSTAATLDAETAIQLSIAVMMALVFGALTVRSWARLQLDR
jgi:ABC-2 type transport system permease protein